jgi:hypothetical protein
MNNKKICLSFILCIMALIQLKAQNIPSLIIDSSEMQFSDVSLPYWLKAGQTVDLGPNAKKASIIEFTINNSNLDFSRVFSLVTKQTVPSNKVWKIEGIGLKLSDTSLYTGSTLIIGGGGSSLNTLLPSIFQSPIKYETPGTYSWKVPPGITKICIEAWGGGGGGGNAIGLSTASGGGGGGYGYGCYTVVPGTTYSITVGDGGVGGSNGGNSSVGNLITSTGGKAGTSASNSNCTGASGGLGGTSNGSFIVNGANGSNGQPCGTGGSSYGGWGGRGGNGGAGGRGDILSSTAGQIIGGGGGAASSNNSSYNITGSSGARGQVYIYF